MNTTNPCNFVIFGATGNLSTYKLLPALFRLDVADSLADDLKFIAISHRAITQEQWIEYMRAALQEEHGNVQNEDVLARFLKRFTYVQGDFADPEAYKRIKELLERPEHAGQGNIYYLSIKPADYINVVHQLDRAGMNQPHGAHRIVIEKPFGQDIESAVVLNEVLHRSFGEQQIYRIDHYLGKETVQNLMVFRLANTLIEPLWNRNFIDHVQITVAEQVGIEGRADYYDKSGALRDMLQNHLMQLLTSIAMEPPPALEADALRDEKVKVLRSIRSISKRSVHAHAFRAQYGPGAGDGGSVVGYQDEKGVEKNSVTETFIAAKFYIDNWRWRGVPFYLRTGKRMAKQLSLIAIRFRHPPQLLFRETPLESVAPNWVLLSLQPSESMHMEIHVKKPGLEMDTRVIALNASYRKPDERSLPAYETLLLDVIEGDRTLFIRFDEVEWSWRVVDPILKYWAQEREFIHTYPAGSWGPVEANRLFDSEDHEWRNDV